MKPFLLTVIILITVIPVLVAQSGARDSVFRDSVRVLRDVEVKGKGPVVRSGLDKKIFAVNQSLISVGGSAAELLQNVPGLQVDGNGNLNLRGAANVKVLVDGKQSLVGGGSVAQILQSIPAASIEKIEVITSPSAKYEAAGEGVINIILKKGARSGFNSSVNATGGTRENYNAGASISYRRDKLNLFGNYSFQHRNTYSNGYQNMTYLASADGTFYSKERFPSATITDLHDLLAGFACKLSAKDLLSVSGQFNSSSRNRNEHLTVDDLTQQQTPAQLSTRANTTHGWNTTWGATLDLTHRFTMTNEELDFDFAWSTGKGSSFQQYITDVFNVNGSPVHAVPDILQDTKGRTSHQYNIQLDYSLPVGKEGKLEAGARSQLLQNNNRQRDASFDTLSGAFKPDYTFINFFRSDNQVHAVYLNYRQQLKSWTIQVGLRAEAGRFAATLQNYDSTGGLISSPIHVNTNGLYPSLFLTRQLTKSQALQLSYSRRINRPTDEELDPFPDVSDPVNYDHGNPMLRPERIHSVEFTYKKTWPAVTVTSGLYYTQVNNVIKHLQLDPVGDVTITIPENFRRAINTGAEFIGNVRVSPFWSFTANVNLYDRINSAAPQFGILATEGISWNGNITNDFSLTKGLGLQLRADYKAGELIVQDRYRAAYGFDAGAKYDFAHKKATLSFSARDIFNTRRWTFLRVSDALLLDFQRVTYSARAALTFTWRFGKTGGEQKGQKHAGEQPPGRIENR